MELLLRLWRESLKRVLPAALLMAAAAAALFFLFRCYSLAALFTPKTLSGLTPENIDGAWVSDELRGISAAFARETVYRGDEPSEVRSACYAVEIGDGCYIALRVRGSAVDRAEALLSACDEKYLSGDDWAVLPAFHISGTVRAMDGELLELYHALAGGDASVRRALLPYLLDVGRLDGHPPAVLWLVSILCLALLAAAVASVVWSVTWGGQKRLLKRASELGELPRMVQKLERFYKETEPVGGVWMSPLYILFQDGPVSVLCRPWDVAWAYRKPLRVTGGRWSVLSFRMMDGARHRVLMREYDARRLLYQMLDAAPGIEQGWSRVTERAYRTDRASFAANWNRYRTDILRD